MRFVNWLRSPLPLHSKSLVSTGDSSVAVTSTMRDLHGTRHGLSLSTIDDEVAETDVAFIVARSFCFCMLKLRLCSDTVVETTT
jgi:hypothetical protein